MVNFLLGFCATGIILERPMFELEFDRKMFHNERRFVEENFRE